jgi:hypothetical protein
MCRAPFQYATLFDRLVPGKGLYFFNHVVQVMLLQYNMYGRDKVSNVCNFFFSKNEMPLFDSVNVEKLIPRW